MKRCRYCAIKGHRIFVPSAIPTRRSCERPRWKRH